MPNRNGYGTGYAQVGRAMSDNISKRTKSTSKVGKGYTGRWTNSPSTYLNKNIWNRLTDNQRRSLEDLSSRGVSKDRITTFATNMINRNGGSRSQSSNVTQRTSNTSVQQSSNTTVPTYNGGTLPGATVYGRRRNNTTTQSSSNARVPSSVKNTPAVSNKPSTHTIAAGETLGSIAKKYGVDWRQLAKDNGIDNPNLIIAGRKLNINGATKQPRKRSRVSLQDQRPAPQPRLGISRTDVLRQLAPVGQPSDDVAPAYRGATNPYTDPRQLWI